MTWVPQCAWVRHLPETAPYFEQIAEGPAGAQAHWVTASDGVRLRAVLWPEGRKGTILIFPGRTEYAEKYGRLAVELGAMGYAGLAIDWRGQGLADRLIEDPTLGHVRRFSDYQRDIAAVLALPQVQALPRPWILMAHSMGGCIGLRALIEGLPVQAAAFSAPMWGLSIAPTTRPLAWGLSWAAELLGKGARRLPGRPSDSYILVEPFETNALTSDAGIYAYMVRQAAHDPRLALGSPSITWLYEALVEMRHLRTTARPDIPVYCALGSDESIVDPGAIRQVMDKLPQGRLRLFEGARHEIPMERAAVRRGFLDDLDALASGL